MEKTLQELADLLQGSIIQGDPSLKLTGVNGLEEAGPTEISFAVPPIWNWPVRAGPAPS